MSPSDDSEQINDSGRYDDSRSQSSRVGRDGFTAGRDIYIGGKPPKNRKPAMGKDSRRRRRRPWLKAVSRRVWVRWAIGAGTAGTVALVVVLVLVLMPSEKPGVDARKPLTTIQMAGSSTFFSDSNVAEELRRLGITVQSTSLGSRQICTEPKVIATYDIADSGSEAAATCAVKLVQGAGRTPNEASPYDELMVVMTYKPIVALLKQLHIASEVNGVTVFNVAKYLKVFASGERWKDIPGNTTYPSNSRLLLWSTDPKESNSGGMLADMAYAAQIGGDPPTSIGPRDSRVPVIRSLFTALGSVENHTPVLLNQFLIGGMGAYPMAMVYESDYLSAELSHEAQDPNLTVMYPTPDVLTAETLVSWTPAGKRLIDAIQSPGMAAPEEAHGYRTEADRAGFVTYMADRGIAVPGLDELVKTLQITYLPTEDVLEELINAVATSQPG
jgi:hypothetical protein